MCSLWGNKCFFFFFIWYSCCRIRPLVSQQCYSVSVEGCSVEVSLSSMVQCSVGCCSAADMSKCSPTPLHPVLLPLLPSVLRLDDSRRCCSSRAPPLSFLHSPFHFLDPPHFSSLSVLRSHFNLPFHLHLLICPLLICTLPYPSPHPLPLILLPVCLQSPPLCPWIRA